MVNIQYGLNQGIARCSATLQALTTTKLRTCLHCRAKVTASSEFDEYLLQRVAPACVYCGSSFFSVLGT
jgi:DNA-directed RNA polymerase subunit RPC12/RpoP